jgi:hypothetical protein
MSESIRLLDIYTKDTYGVIELSKEAVESLIRAMDHSSVDFDHKNDTETAKAYDFFVNKFYPELTRIKKIMDGGQ